MFFPGFFSSFHVNVSLKVFRRFHESSEDLRRTSEARYRSVLLEAVHDAVYLSAQNRQLHADNQQLRKGGFRSTLALLTLWFTEIVLSVFFLLTLLQLWGS